MRITTTNISGAPYERGRAHGHALRTLVQGHVAAWLDSLAQAKLGDPAAYVEAMLRGTDFRTATGEHTPGLLDEVDGIADGAEVPRPLLFGLQLLDEEWAWRARRADAANRLEKCSSLAIVSDGGPTWIGQNMDLGGYTDGWQALIHIAADGETPSALVFTTAGMIGLMGVNAAGVGVCVNSIPQLASASEGVPVAFVVRRILQCRTLAQASDVVRTIPHATNQHYLVAEPGAARSFEAGAAGVTEYRSPYADRVLHTNHPLSEAPAAPEPDAWRRNTAARLACLDARLGRGEPGLAQIQAALSSFDDPYHPVCRLRRPDNSLIGFTTGSMITALRAPPSPLQSWVSAGPPSIGGYSAFEVARDEPRG